MKPILTILFVALLCFGCNKTRHEPTETQNTVLIDTLQGNSLINTPLIRRQVDPRRDSLQLKNYLQAKDAFNLDSSITENRIWLGRRIAYLGDYKQAIKIYSNAIKINQREPRFYRHRGHRYISIREFDKAIEDFEKAVELIQGTDDVIEPDGIPNRLNQPVSSLHTNIWYHLGLAYYLKGDMANALEAYQECLKASDNDDMKVAASHWLYMILRRLDRQDEAVKILESVNSEMNIIENNSYHELLLFYKGELTENDLLRSENGSIGASEATLYGLGNWYYYNDQKPKAINIFGNILNTGNWAAFGYIAAEAEISRDKVLNSKTQ